MSTAIYNLYPKISKTPPLVTSEINYTNTFRPFLAGCPHAGICVKSGQEGQNENTNTFPLALSPQLFFATFELSFSYTIDSYYLYS